MKNTLQKLIAQFNADIASNLQDIAEILPDGRYAEALDLQTENLTLERVVDVLENDLKELASAQS
jgi:Tfp pilus assembly protein PilN